MDEFKESDFLLLLSLKSAKKTGELDTEEHIQSQECKWRNLVDYDYLEDWLINNNEELRLHTLELLTISKKSTQTFTKQELDLIMVFLNYNFGEKLEYVPLIKRVIKRANDSYAVLKRQLERENKFKELQKVHNKSPVFAETSSAVQFNIKFYQEFIAALHRLCLTNLYPGAVNVRKKSSLQILCLMDEFLTEELRHSLWTPEDVKELFDCLLLDTYELNKEMAYQLIKSCGLLELLYDTDEKVLELINVAVEMGNSIRPLDSITAAYMFKISMFLPNIQNILLRLIHLESLNDTDEKTTLCMVLLITEHLKVPVKLAMENIAIAASKHSLYGYIFCIHSILTTINLRALINDENWRIIVGDILKMCFELITAASQIVNNSSPEGHLPMDLDPQHLGHIVHETQEIVITPQMVLLCSWRTIKEISLFFGYLTLNATIFNEKTNIGLLTETQIKEIGNELVTMLCETKHRGAFEQAHVGFGQLCSRLWHLEKEEKFLRQLPKFWLQQILLAVIGLISENSKLCATRRSAGVPFMVQALVTSEIKKRNDPKTLAFHSVMRILLKLTQIESNFNNDDAVNILFKETLFEESNEAEFLYNINQMSRDIFKLNEVTEIKTHTLNILRALYRHCLLGELVKDYVADGFIAAFRSYDGQSWAERNAATLLFSSLVIRVFGVQRTKDHVNLTMHNKMTGKKFFEKFPSLLPFLLNELTTFVDKPEDQIKPKIQCILLILSRLCPSATSEAGDEDWKIDEFINLVSKCGKSRVYKTRELAARALVPLLTEKNVESILCNLLCVIVDSNLSLNSLHGYTLQLLELVRSQQFLKVCSPEKEFEKLFEFTLKNIINNLNISNDSPACYPVAMGMLEIFIELVKLDSYRWIYKNLLFEKILQIVQSYVAHGESLKDRPGKELYESVAINLMIAVSESDSFSKSDIENSCTSFWERALNTKNTEVLTIIWSKLIAIIRKMNDPMLFEVVFLSAVKLLENLPREPDLQDAIFEFLYCAIKDIDSNEDIECIPCTIFKKEDMIPMCLNIFEKLVHQLEEKTFYLRGEFFKLFGRVFGILLKNRQDTRLSQKSRKSIYQVFSTHSGMESNLDCRIGISEVLIEIYIENLKGDDIYLVLEWWTILLYLLYDDNALVRSNAAKIVCELSPENKLVCGAVVINTFFEKFVATVGRNQEAVAVAFFCWSMTSAAEVLEEMDDTDVFNKSYNYECFEPLQITNKCVSHLKNIVSKRNSHSSKTSQPIREWVEQQLDIKHDLQFDSLSDLILKYKNMIPDSEDALKRILDPTFPAKIIKVKAYYELKNSVISENGFTSE